MNGLSLKNRIIISSLARFLLIFTVSMLGATFVNYDTYKDFYSKRLFRMHTADLSTLARQMTIKLNFLLAQGDSEGIQSVLDASFGLFGFVITDCKLEGRLCPEQKIIYASSAKLPWVHPPLPQDIATASFAPLRIPPGVSPSHPAAPSHTGNPGEIIGRLYVVNNMPHSFTGEFIAASKAPFADVGARRFYLRTTLSFLVSALIVWTISELYFMVRRKKLLFLQQRELELKQAVNRQMKQLTEKDAQISRLSEQSGIQYETYMTNIRTLQQKMQNEEEYRIFSEQIIADLERDKVQEAEKYAEELAVIRTDMERLQDKVNEYVKSSRVASAPSFQALEEAVRTPHFSNLFEQTVFETIAAIPQYKTGEWRMLSNFDVAPGRNYRQFTDFILFNKDALIILEAKYYVGLIDSPGDFKNDVWFSASSQKKKIDCLWGENPYHQLNEYSMSLMKILKQRSPWVFQIFGVIIFPDEADISKIGEHIGKFYRITTVSKTVALFESIFAEARRFQSAKNPQRPTALQVEELLRGRKLSH